MSFMPSMRDMDKPIFAGYIVAYALLFCPL